MSLHFYSNGKLLLTGEYAVLDGALSLALPTTYGQSLKISETADPELSWKSYDEQGNLWFDAVFESTPDAGSLRWLKSKAPSSGQQRVAEMLLKILTETRKLNPQFFSAGKGFAVETRLDFPRNWGLGSSSTLINNLAQWAQIDAYVLLQRTFGGSSYDIACAQHDHPIQYAINTEGPQVKEVTFSPPFIDQLYFIHLNKKQNSREGISRYRQLKVDKRQLVERINNITKQIITCKNLQAFEALLLEHEAIISRALRLPTVKESLFPDFDGTTKSLGAWGGDFMLATGNEGLTKYFKKKGYDTVIPYSKMILS